MAVGALKPVAARSRAESKNRRHALGVPGWGRRCPGGAGLANVGQSSTTNLQTHHAEPPLALRNASSLGVVANRVPTAARCALSRKNPAQIAIIFDVHHVDFRAEQASWVSRLATPTEAAACRKTQPHQTCAMHQPGFPRGSGCAGLGRRWGPTRDRTRPRCAAPRQPNAAHGPWRRGAGVHGLGAQ